MACCLVEFFGMLLVGLRYLGVMVSGLIVLLWYIYVVL